MSSSVSVSPGNRYAVSGRLPNESPPLATSSIGTRFQRRLLMDKPIATCLVLAALAAGPLIADEGRIPVFAPTVITQPGYYVLTRDISVSGGHVITIQANNVTLDLNGRTIVSSGVGVADDVV